MNIIVLMKNINQLEDERKIIIQKHDKYNSHENIFLLTWGIDLLQFPTEDLPPRSRPDPEKYEPRT